VRRGSQLFERPSFMGSRARSNSVDRLMRVGRDRQARTVGAGLRVVTEGFDTRDLKEAKALLGEFWA
jgi:hypothetical protein